MATAVPSRRRGRRASSQVPTTAAPPHPTADTFTDRILLKASNFSVLERKALPTEIQQLILQADPYLDPFRAELDNLTGFAFIISREYCFVWNWSRKSTSTTYVFPLPIPTLSPTLATFSPLAYASFVPASSNQLNREPGLIVVSLTGEVRYWDSISLALSGVNRFKSLAVELAEGELIRGIKLIQPNLYLLTTSHSRILLITITSIGGNSNVTVRPFSKPLGWAGSVWSFFGGKSSDPRAGILAFTISKAENLGYAVTDRNVQVWELPGVGEERLIVEMDLFSGILEAVFGRKVGNEQWALNEGKVEVLDAQVTSDANLAVLISHTTESTAVNSLSYAIVVLEVGKTQASLSVVGIQHLSYESPPDPRPLSSPKLSLSSTAAFVVFVDTVVMISLDSSTEEIISLASATNRYLGFSNPSPIINLLTASASILSVEFNTSAVSQLVPGTISWKTEKLKAKIEQAIFYGGLEETPLRFTISSDGGDLQIAAGTVSKEILTSSSTNMPSIIDLRAQLADRVLRARGLINFINENGLLGKLSQSSRRELSWDAEKLEAAVALWHQQNIKLADGEAGANLLAQAIETFMGDSSDDVVRVFFRTRVGSISSILELVTKLAKAALSNSNDNVEKSSILFEANQIISLIFRAITYHRLTSPSLYGLDQNHLPLEAWSSKTSILEGLIWHFESTDLILRERSKDFEERFGGIKKESILADMRRMVEELAGFVFAAFEERIRFLNSTNVEGDKAVELRILLERYHTLRPKIIGILVFHDRVSVAFELAEKYKDFNSLVQLCFNSSTASEKIQYFMTKYLEEFAFALYDHLVQENRFQELLTRREEWSELLTKFLDREELTGVDWLNDFAIARYDHAVRSLALEASKEEDLAQKKITLSLAKLSQIAQATSDSIDSEFVQREIEVIDDNLDLVNSQLSLLALFDLSLSAVESRDLSSIQAELITSRVAPALVNRPALSQMYTLLVQRLVEGITLSPEDLIDLFTLKVNEGEESSHFSTALDILIRSKTIPVARQQVALQSIWRRIYLQDDWASLRNTTGLTDEQVSTALQNTALYSTLISSQGSNLPNTLFLTPTEAIFSGSSEEIAARFPEAPKDIIENLVQDFQVENEEIQSAIEEVGLLEFCKEVERLFKEGMN